MITFKKKLKSIVEDNETITGRLFDVIVQSLIVISIISFTIETLPNVNETLREILSFIEIVVVILFSAEYLIRLYVSDKKISFIFSFNGMIDLIAILPFYIASGIDLRSIRIFRLFRLFRTFKIVRYSKSLNLLRDAFLFVKNELILFTMASTFLLYLASVGIYYFENEPQPEAFASVIHSLWWAVVTLTSVGYGDIYPITTGGKIFTSIIVFIGIGVLAIPTGLLASSLTNIIKQKRSTLEE